jgi:glycosyltransferase involved in cell wall biosynthesis
MPNPAVTVVVPAYKVTPYIAETLDSLRAQTFRNFETIVVNDGCPDTENLEKVLEPYRSEIIYIKQDNRGLAGARNTAILASSAPLVALLDSDDIWEPEYLAVQTAMFESHPEADIVYPNATFFGETPFDGKTVMDIFPSRGEVTFQRIVLNECQVFVGATIRRDVLLQAGMFDANLRSAEDLDLWLRLAKTGRRFVYHRQSLVRYRTRAASLSGDHVWMLRNLLKVYEKLAAMSDLTPEQRAALDTGIRRENANLDFYLGKKALYSKQREEALERLTRANLVMQNKKITLGLLLLRFAPQLLYKLVYRRHPTEFSFMH